MSTVLITGASGFIGSAALRALRAQSPAKTLILAGRGDNASTLPAGCRHLRLDLTSDDIALVSGIDTVLHLAGEKRDESRMDAVNHVGATRLVEAAARAGVKRFVHLSSVGVFGAPKHAGVVDAYRVRTPRNTYEVSKNAGELAVRERCAALGLVCLVLQPSNVVGIVAGRSYPLLGLARMVARGWFRHLGRGDAWVNYVAVEDVAAALVAATQDDSVAGVFIVNTPAPLRSLVCWMAEELGVPTPAKQLPLWVGAAAAAAGALGRAMLRRELPLSPERFLELTNTTQYDGSAITRVLQPVYSMGIEAALRAMVRQYRREGLV
jgi:nucleoside-diphosphate-sugar epimerase